MQFTGYDMVQRVWVGVRPLESWSSPCVASIPGGSAAMPPHPPAAILFLEQDKHNNPCRPTGVNKAEPHKPCISAATPAIACEKGQTPFVLHRPPQPASASFICSPIVSLPASPSFLPIPTQPAHHSSSLLHPSKNENKEAPSPASSPPSFLSPHRKKSKRNLLVFH